MLKKLIVGSVLSMSLFLAGAAIAATLEVFTPVGEAETILVKPAARIDTLDGKKVAMLWNGEPGGELLLDEIEAQLKAQYKDVTFYRWPASADWLSRSNLQGFNKSQPADAVILAVADSSECAARVANAGILLERLGLPSVMLVTDTLVGLGQQVLESYGMSEYPLAVVAGPIAGLAANDVKARITPKNLGEIVAGLTQQPQKPAPKAATGTPTLTFTGSDLFEAQKAMNEFFLGAGWGDGLPLVPPTADLVSKMLAGTKRSPDEVIAEIGISTGAVTVENIAINAVMAGARPEYMPVLIAMMEAAGKPETDFLRLHGTTNPVTPMVIVTGPITDMAQLNINSGMNAFGPGTQANATIGRVLRLLMQTTGGAAPGSGSKASQGQFARYTAAWAVNRHWNDGGKDPFPSLQEQLLNNQRLNSQLDKGYEEEYLPPRKVEPIGPDDDAVFIFVMGDRNNINDNSSQDAESLLNGIATSMLTAELSRPGLSANVSGPYLIALAPLHAQILADSGWTLEQMRQHLFERAVMPMDRWVPGQSDTLETISQEWLERDAAVPFGKDGMLNMVEHPDNIFFTVVGGDGNHSAVFVGNYAPIVAQKIDNDPTAAAVAEGGAASGSSGPAGIPGAAVSRARMTWDNATAWCDQQNGSLPRINDSDAWASTDLDKITDIEGFGAPNTPWPSGLPFDRYWVGTAPSDRPGSSWYVYPDDGNIRIGNGGRGNPRRVLCMQ